MQLILFSGPLYKTNLLMWRQSFIYERATNCDYWIILFDIRFVSIRFLISLSGFYIVFFIIMS